MNIPVKGELRTGCPGARRKSGALAKTEQSTAYEGAYPEAEDMLTLFSMDEKTPDGSDKISFTEVGTTFETS